MVQFFSELQEPAWQTERHGGFMGKSGPTILFSEDFTLHHESLLEFIDYCREWVRKLYEIDNRISLKFVVWPKESVKRHRAVFMLQGTPFIHIGISTLDLENCMHSTQDLIRNGFNSNCCNWVRDDRMLLDAFIPNLKAAINAEMDRLLQKKIEFDNMLTQLDASSNDSNTDNPKS